MKQTICIFGDSIAWGACDPERGGWVARLRSFIETNEISIAVYNCGVSGDTTVDLLKRFEVECSARKPTMIIFAIGINDSRYILTKDHPEVPLNSFKTNLTTLLQNAIQFSSRILALGLTRIEENKTTPCAWKPTKFYEEERVKSYDAIIQEVSKEHGASYIPLYDQLENSDLEDGLHPNTAGHEKIFLAVKDILQVNRLLPKA